MSSQNNSRIAKIIKGSAITFFIKITGMILSYAVIFEISSRLGAGGVGYYHFMLQVLTILGMIMGLGLNNAVLRYVGQFNNEVDRSKIHELDNFVKWIIGPLVIGVSLILYFNADFIISLIGKDKEFVYGLRFVAISLPFFTLNQISVEFIRGFQKIKMSESIRSIYRPFLILLGMVFFFKQNLSTLNVLQLLTLSLIFNFLMSRLIVMKELRKIPRDNLDLNRKELLQTSYPMLVTSLASTLISAMPIFFLEFVLSNEEVGIYAVSFRLASLVSLSLVVVNTMSAPNISELFWKGNFKELQLVINKSTRLMSVFAFIVLLIVLFAGRQIIGFFGTDFINGYPVLLILSFAQFANVTTGSVSILFNMTGKQRLLRKVNIYIVLLGFSLFAILTYFSILTITTASIVVFLKIVILNMTLSFLARRFLQINNFLRMRG